MAASPDHKDRAHAPFAPSGAERWLNCPTAVRYAEQLPPQADTAATTFGTACHQIAEDAIRGDLNPVSIQIKCHEAEAAWASKWGVELTERDDMMAVVMPYVEYVRSRTRELAATGDFTRRIEERVTIVGKDCWGSLDCSLFVPFASLEIIDLKGGAGKCVSPEENEQLLTYAVGEAERNGWAFEVCTLTIVQPRRTDGQPAALSWNCTPADLKAHQKRIKAAIKNGKALDAKPVAGNWCGWCQAKALCPAQRERAVAAFDTLDAAPLEPVRLPDIGTVTPEQMARILEAEPIVTKFFGAVRALALTNPPPGFKIVEGTSKRRWTGDATDQLEGVGLLDKFQTTKLVGITEAEKLLKKIAPDLIATVFEKPPGKPTLAPVSDKRPALDPLSALPPVDDAE